MNDREALEEIAKHLFYIKSSSMSRMSRVRDILKKVGVDVYLCEVCGQGPATLEPRFNYYICDEHQKTSPVEVSRSKNKNDESEYHYNAFSRWGRDD